MSILKYIDKLSSIYKLATTHFNHDGRGLFNYLWTYGHKAYTTKQNQKRENVWKDASVASLRIPVSEDTPQLWKEWCVEHGALEGSSPVHLINNSTSLRPSSQVTCVTLAAKPPGEVGHLFRMTR